jgi:hypothetical protein
MTITKYILLISALIEMNVMSTHGNDNGEKAVALIGIGGGICLILFRKRVVRDIMQPADSWVKEPLSQRELTVGLKRADAAKFCERLFEVVIVISGILVFAMGLPSFVPILHRPVIIICLSFFFMFLPAILGASILTLVLFPLWGWKLRKYRKTKLSMPQQALQGDDVILQKLQKETDKYGIMCSAIAFIACLLIALKIALTFNIFNCWK